MLVFDLMWHYKNKLLHLYSLICAFIVDHLQNFLLQLELLCPVSKLGPKFQMICSLKVLKVSNSLYHDAFIFLCYRAWVWPILYGYHRCNASSVQDLSGNSLMSIASVHWLPSLYWVFCRPSSHIKWVLTSKSHISLLYIQIPKS